MITPRVFIGSSSEGLEVARAIKKGLGREVDSTVWDEDIFRLSETAIESLVRSLGNFDFAVLVFTPDDRILNRTIEVFSVRDNVVFELGLFLGHLGRSRTFVVHNFENGAKIPTDLAGVTLATFKRPPDNNLDAALEQACKGIRREIARMGSGGEKRKELGVLYRIANACTQSYDNIYIDFLNYVNYKAPERFGEIRGVLEFLEDLFRDYVYPLLNSKELQDLRLYFAYYLGDGAAIDSEQRLPTHCRDIDSTGKPFDGQFVIGLSNPTGVAQERWRTGRAISGYERKRPTSTAADVFASGSMRYKSDLRQQGMGLFDYDTPGELAISTVPVEWRTTKAAASIGVVTVSSREPNSISQSLQVRVQLLANVIGFLFSVYAVENSEDLDIQSQRSTVDYRQAIGFKIVSDPDGQFRRRAIALRQKIAGYFEDTLLAQRLHDWDGGYLKVVERESHG